MQVKTMFWVCKVKEAEINLVNGIKPILLLKPEIWFSGEFDALKWIQENKGSCTIVKVFETT